jgi:lysophospholipase L1-like esterase
MLIAKTWWARWQIARPLAPLTCLQACGLCLLLALWAHDAQAEGKRVLVFGDSNTWGWKPHSGGLPGARLADRQRWTSVLQQHLGPAYIIVVDGLNGRTVDASYAEPVASLQGADFNGELALRVALAREAPLDLVLIMLGTNDTQDPLNRSAAQIAQGVAKLVAITLKDYAGVFTTAQRPTVLVVAPPALGDISKTPFREVFAGGAREKSGQLAAALAQRGAADGFAVVNATRLVGQAAGVDGVHLTWQQHQRLGVALAPVVRRALTRKPAG